MLRISADSGRHGRRAGPAVSARNAWAVGGTADQPYILGWNGTIWRQVPVPKKSVPGELLGITVVSAKDAWAVGNANGALLLHWDGAGWHEVSNRWQPGGGSLWGVAARSARDVWAVGTAGFNSLILRWNGVAWTRLGGPRYGRWGFNIQGIAMPSPNLAWLVGQAKDGLPMILRWNGTRLQPMPRPKPLVGGGLSSVSAVSARQAWAVGTGDLHGLSVHTWILRWLGRGWRKVPSPAGRVEGQLIGVVARSVTDAWGVDFTGFGFGDGSRGFILHWMARLGAR